MLKEYLKERKMKNTHSRNIGPRLIIRPLIILNAHKNHNKSSNTEPKVTG